MSELTLASSPPECHEDKANSEKRQFGRKTKLLHRQAPPCKKKTYTVTVHFHVTATSERSSNKRYSGLVVSDVRLVLAPL